MASLKPLTKQSGHVNQMLALLWLRFFSKLWRLSGVLSDWFTNQSTYYHGKPCLSLSPGTASATLTAAWRHLPSPLA